MKRYLHLFSQHSIYNLNKNSLLKPNVSYCQEEDHLHYNPIDYSKEYLTFDILTDGVIYWTHNNYRAQRTISYSLDGGNTWTDITSSGYSNPSSINVSAGDKVLFKGTNTEYLLAFENDYSASFYNSTASFNVYGNILSLFYGDNFANKTEFPEVQTSYASCGDLFAYTKVVDASKLILLPMTLSTYCYYGMFSNCTNLTKAPELPALTLSNYCYLDMFRGCTSLNYIKAMFTTTPGNNYTADWVNGVSANGTFVKNINATWTDVGNNAIPSGWTVDVYPGEDAIEYAKQTLINAGYTNVIESVLFTDVIDGKIPPAVFGTNSNDEQAACVFLKHDRTKIYALSYQSDIDLSNRKILSVSGEVNLSSLDAESINVVEILTVNSGNNIMETLIGKQMSL